MSARTACQYLTQTRRCVQEFKFQGHDMAGPCARFSSAGTHGRHPQNVRRDIFRAIDAIDPDVKARKHCYRIAISKKRSWTAQGQGVGFDTLHAMLAPVPCLNFCF